MEEIDEAANIIKKGGIVVFPTETVYGIGADALNEDAIRKLYSAKGNPLNKKTSILVSSIEMLESVTQNISDIERKLINEFFPGPLTLVLHKKECIPDILTNNEDNVGVRMPANKTAINLINKVGRPIATTSANLHGELSGTDIEYVHKSFGNKVDYYIDGGNSEIGFGSTVLQIIDGIPHIYRQGSITKEQIDKVLKL